MKIVTTLFGVSMGLLVLASMTVPNAGLLTLALFLCGILTAGLALLVEQRVKR